MSIPVRTVAPDLVSLFAQFPPAADLPDYQLVSAASLPPVPRKLLVHEHHMTVTVEAHHGDLVDVRPLARRHDGLVYSRKIILTLQRTAKVVLFGIVRIHLNDCSEAVRQAILAENTPLGRILIEHDVLRRIEPTAYLKIRPGPRQLAWFGRAEPVALYGRLAIIHCDERPAVELLEVVPDEPGLPSADGGTKP